MKLRAGMAVAAVVGASLVFSHPAHAAATFTVTTTADTHDLTPGDGICADSGGFCSLRAAIEESNADASGITVDLPAGNYVFTSAGPSVSNGGLTILGAGANTAIIDANHVASSTGIYVTPAGVLDLTAVTIQNATASGIVDTGQLTLDLSVVSNNANALEGGGLDIGPGGVAAVTSSRFTGNTVTMNSGFGGAGIANRAGTLTLLGSTIDNNTSAGYGGGVSGTAPMTLTNDTITANAGNGNGGGGIAAFSGGTGTISVQSSTIDANSAIPYGGGIEGSGTTPFVHFKNTIVAGNTATNNGNNCFIVTSIASDGHNVDGDASCPFTAAGDQQNTNPALGPLQDNGGPVRTSIPQGVVLTQAIGVGSPAADTGSPDCPPPSTDARGIPRPIGPACDVGAYELLPFPSASLPAVMNNAYGGFSTTAYIKNTGTGPAAVDILYYDQTGGLIGHDHTSGLAVNATWIVPQTNGTSIPDFNAGSAIVYSNQPIASFVNEFHGSADGSSYTGIPIGLGGSTTLYAPNIMNNAYGGYTTGIGLINQSSVSTNVTVTYRDASGSPAAVQTITNLPPHAYQGLYSGDNNLALPGGFAGTATLVSSSGQISAVINETGPGGQFSSYDAVSNPNSTLVAPIALNNAYGGFNTGIAIENTTGTSGTFSIKYYNATGSLVATTNHSIAGNGYAGIYQPTDLGTSTGAFSAVVTSTTSVAVIVNETAPVTGPAQQSTGYNTLPVYASLVSLPMVESSGPDGWSTGLGIVNTSGITVTVAVNYFDVATGSATGTSQSKALAPNAFWGVYQPASGLPIGTRASAVISAPGGSVIVVCNESNSTTFMSYGGQ